MRYALEEFEDWRTFQSLGGAANTTLNIDINGWEWWILLSCQTQVINTAGAVAARFSALISQSGNQLYGWVASNGTGIGQSETMECGFNLNGIAVVNTVQTVALPLNLVVGDGRVALSWIGGDAATRIGGTTLVIVGKQSRPRPK